MTTRFAGIWRRVRKAAAADSKKQACIYKVLPVGTRARMIDLLKRGDGRGGTVTRSGAAPAGSGWIYRGHSKEESA